MMSIRHLRPAVVAALIAGAIMPAGADNAPPPANEKPKPSVARSLAIEVISANYGHSGVHTSCVVTPVVKSSCNGRSRCVLAVGDDLCRPPNPLPAGLILTLTVEYKCWPVTTARTTRADKPFRIVIDCGGSAGEFSPGVGSKP